MRGFIDRRLKLGCLVLALLLSLFAAPTTSAQSKPQADIEATFWAGTDSQGGTFVFEFAQAGKFRYLPSTGVISSGNWKQRDNAVEMELNGELVRYVGTIQDDQIKGEATSESGLTRTWVAIKQPSVITNATPGFPPIAFAAHAGGDVIVELKLTATGDVLSARAVSGHPLLQQASVTAVRLWKFAAAPETDKPRLARIIFSFRPPPATQAKDKAAPPVFVSPYQAMIFPPPIVAEYSYSSVSSK